MEKYENTDKTSQPADQPAPQTADQPASQAADQPASQAAEQPAPQASADAPSLAGLGVDIVEIERMEKAIARTPRIIQRVFSETERTYALGKVHPATHYALFFAAKEAVLKALGTGFSGMNYTDVEVDHDRFGKPLVLLHGHAQEVAFEQGIIDVQLSLSYTHQVGVASAVAIKEEHRPVKEKKNDPYQELQQQFKELRSLLDDMDTRLKEHESHEATEPPRNPI